MHDSWELPVQSQGSKTDMYRIICSEERLFSAWQKVKNNGSAGGVDGKTIETYEAELDANLARLSRELTDGTFMALPYKEVKIPKNGVDFRSLSLPSIQDKIVQTAVKEVIEPVLDNEFLDVSYGYRANKGAARAINRVTHLIRKEKREWLAICDIDKYFDSIDHGLLEAMIRERIADENVIDLIIMWIKMGKINYRMRWMDAIRGIPQGNIISPLLANLYLHPLDVMMVSRKYGYVRYADDFVILGKSEGEAQQALQEAKVILRDRLGLCLNPEEGVRSISAGFEFLGITFKGDTKTITQEKMIIVKGRLKRTIDQGNTLDIQKINEAIGGIKHYYGSVLNQHELEELDEWLVHCLKRRCQSIYGREPRRLDRQILENALRSIIFLSARFAMKKNRHLRDILAYCIREKRTGRTGEKKTGLTPEKIVRKRKKEYEKLESEGHELVVTTPGAFLGKTKSCIVVKHRGKKTNEVKTTNLNHIFVTGRGVTVSSNVIEFCSERHIPIDYIRFDGKPYARLYSFYDQNARIQLAQLAACGNEKGSAFAKSIVYGKIKNQLNLAKYYHKYRKEKDSTFSTLFREKTSRIELHLKELGETNDSDHDILRGKLFSIEGRAAQNYWEITKRLLAGMLVFEGREGKGATDVVNSMLNYGYGILQAKVWDAVIRSSLSPFISFLHKPQRNKPTFIFDLIEQFRVQAVDRVIFSMINKGVEVTMEKERLSNKTKTRLIGHILERMNTYEKYRGRRIRFVEIIREQARGAALYFTGETKKYLPYIGKW